MRMLCNNCIQKIAKAGTERVKIFHGRCRRQQHVIFTNCLFDRSIVSQSYESQSLYAMQQAPFREGILERTLTWQQT